MNPLNNAYFGQALHREYEARYNRQFDDNEPKRKASSFVSRHKVSVAMSSVAAAVAAVVALVT